MGTVSDIEYRCTVKTSPEHDARYLTAAPDGLVKDKETSQYKQQSRGSLRIEVNLVSEFSFPVITSSPRSWE